MLLKTQRQCYKVKKNETALCRQISPHSSLSQYPFVPIPPHILLLDVILNLDAQACAQRLVKGLRMSVYEVRLRARLDTLGGSRVHEKGDNETVKTWTRM